MATLRIIDGAYIIDYRENGRRRRQSLGRVGTISEREAQKVVDRINKVLTRGYHILHPAPGPAFDSFADDYLRWHAAEYPDSNERIEQIVIDHLIPAFGHYELSAITPRMVEEWKHRRLAAQVNGRTPKSQTVTKELRTLKAILNKAVQWGEIEKNPINYVSAPKQLASKPPRFFTVEELNRIYTACRMQVNGGEGPQPSPLHEHWWRLYANTGLRRAEGLMLRWDGIGRDGMKVLSTEDDRTKSGKWREIPLSPGAQAALVALKKDLAENPREEGNEYVLPRIALPSLSRAFVRDAIRAGIVDGSLHTLRHTYISHLVMAGVPLRTVQVLAGHSTIAVTEKYAHLSRDYLRGVGSAISL